MKEYLIVFSYVKKDYYADNDKDFIMSSIPELDNEIFKANSKKEAIEKFYNCRNREYYIILNIIELGSEE
jgi:hypothetical protein